MNNTSGAPRPKAGDGDRGNRQRLDYPAAGTPDPPSPHHPITLSPSPGRRIENATIPVVASPSGLPTQHLISARDGAEHLFVAQQWLEPGDRVLLHTHPVEEAVLFLSGAGEATLGEEVVPIGAGVSLYIPAGEVHGFHCSEGVLHVVVVFPVPEFAETVMVERIWPDISTDQSHGTSNVDDL